MDYQALKEELNHYFDSLQTLCESKELDPRIRSCLDNATTYLEGALEIIKDRNCEPIEEKLSPDLAQCLEGFRLAIQAALKVNAPHFHPRARVIRVRAPRIYKVRVKPCKSDRQP